MRPWNLPVEVTETWSNTDNGFQRVFLLYNSVDILYTRTYKYKKIMNDEGKRNTKR